MARKLMQDFQNTYNYTVALEELNDNDLVENINISNNITASEIVSLEATIIFIEGISVKYENLKKRKIISLEDVNDLKNEINTSLNGSSYNINQLFPSLENINDPYVALEGIGDSISSVILGISKGISKMLSNISNTIGYITTFIDSQAKIVSILKQRINESGIKDDTELKLNHSKYYSYDNSKYITSISEYQKKFTETVNILSSFNTLSTKFLSDLRLEELNLKILFDFDTRLINNFNILIDFMTNVSKEINMKEVNSDNDINYFSSSHFLGMGKIVKNEAKKGLVDKTDVKSIKKNYRKYSIEFVNSGVKRPVDKLTIKNGSIKDLNKILDDVSVLLVSYKPMHSLINKYHVLNSNVLSSHLYKHLPALALMKLMIHLADITSDTVASSFISSRNNMKTACDLVNFTLKP